MRLWRVLVICTPKVRKCTHTVSTNFIHLDWNTSLKICRKITCKKFKDFLQWFIPGRIFVGYELLSKNALVPCQQIMSAIIWSALSQLVSADHFFNFWFMFGLVKPCLKSGTLMFTVTDYTNLTSSGAHQFTFIMEMNGNQWLPGRCEKYTEQSETLQIGLDKG